MIHPAYQKAIQILITNRCCFACADCSELCPHISKEKQFDISLEDFEKAVATLEDAPMHIGIFGGHPLLHPQFDKICEILRKYIFVKARRELWCSGLNWDKWKSVIEETFYPELVTFNNHDNSYECYHQPVHIAGYEIFTGAVTGNPGKDLQLMWKLIDNCWLQQRWSSIISPLGVYPCEVMAARAVVLGGPKGLPVEKGWWKRPITDWQYQITELCPLCGVCLPVAEKERDNQDYDVISPCLLKKLEKVQSPRVKQEKYKLYDITELQQYYRGHEFEPIVNDYRKRGGYVDFPDWLPWEYRPIIQNAPNKVVQK